MCEKSTRGGTRLLCGKNEKRGDVLMLVDPSIELSIEHDEEKITGKPRKRGKCSQRLHGT